MTVRWSIVATLFVACQIGPVVAADKPEDAAQAAAVQDQTLVGDVEENHLQAKQMPEPEPSS